MRLLKREILVPWNLFAYQKEIRVLNFVSFAWNLKSAPDVASISISREKLVPWDLFVYKKEISVPKEILIFGLHRTLYQL